VAGSALAGLVAGKAAAKVASTEGGNGGGAEAVMGRSPEINSRSCSSIALMTWGEAPRAFKEMSWSAVRPNVPAELLIYDKTTDSSTPACVSRSIS
jgi:hypothetical protein